MKKLIPFLIYVSFFNYALADDLKIESYIKRSKHPDKLFYLDCGTKLIVANAQVSLEVERGIVFTSKEPYSLGNHAYYYLNFVPSYQLIPGAVTIYAELLKEINPFEGNDLNLTKQLSTQGLGLDILGFGVKKNKWTNGDFYTEWSYNNFKYVTKRERDSSTGFLEEPWYIEKYIVKRAIDFNIFSLTFSIVGDISVRKYFENKPIETTTGWQLILKN